MNHHPACKYTPTRNVFLLFFNLDIVTTKILFYQFLAQSLIRLLFSRVYTILSSAIATILLSGSISFMHFYYPVVQNIALLYDKHGLLWAQSPTFFNTFQLQCFYILVLLLGTRVWNPLRRRPPKVDLVSPTSKIVDNECPTQHNQRRSEYGWDIAPWERYDLRLHGRV